MYFSTELATLICVAHSLKNTHVPIRWMMFSDFIRGFLLCPYKEFLGNPVIGQKTEKEFDEYFITEGKFSWQYKYCWLNIIPTYSLECKTHFFSNFMNKKSGMRLAFERVLNSDLIWYLFPFTALTFFFTTNSKFLGYVTFNQKFCFANVYMGWPKEAFSRTV